MNKQTFEQIHIKFLDFMAIFLPGVIWLVLMIATYQFFHIKMILTPLIVWNMINSLSWISIIPLIIASLLIGYILHPFGTPVSAWLLGQFKFNRLLLYYKFPFKELHEEKPYYNMVNELIEQHIGVQAKDLPGYQPFSTAKRFLRMNSPYLWEEIERLESYVEFTAAIFLAATYNLFFAMIILGFQSYYLIFSMTVILISSRAFIIFRYEEVKYTYLNFIVACKLKYGSKSYSNELSIGYE